MRSFNAKSLALVISVWLGVWFVFPILGIPHFLGFLAVLIVAWYSSRIIPVIEEWWRGRKYLHDKRRDYEDRSWR